MAMAVHFINKPDPESRDKYQTSFRRLDELDRRFSSGDNANLAFTPLAPQAKHDRTAEQCSPVFGAVRHNETERSFRALRAATWPTRIRLGPSRRTEPARAVGHK
jgi:hypothetical protein